MAVWLQHRCTQCPSRTDRYGSRPTWLSHSCTQSPSRTDRYSSRPTWLYGHSTDAYSVRPGRTDIAQGQHGCMATAQMHTVSVQDGQIWLKPTWLHHSCTQCPSRTDRHGSRPTWLRHSCTQCPSRTDRYCSRPTWLYGHSTDAHSVRPGRTDIAQDQHGCMATAQMHTVSVQDGQI